MITAGLVVFSFATAPAAAATESPGEWARGLCTAVADWSKDVDATLAAASLDTPAVSATPSEARAALAGTLRKLAKRTDKLAKAVKRGGVPDVEGGKAAVRAFVRVFGIVAGGLRDTRVEVKALPIDDPQAFSASLRLTTVDLSALFTEVNLDFAKLELGGKELEKAAAAEPRCAAFVND
jgi:hypothetical protein